MARVLGLGGVFFRAKDPVRLARWYAENLRMPIDLSFGGTTFKPDDQPPGAYTVWAPFFEGTDYFGTLNQAFMFNLVVDDVHGALAQVAAGGAELVGEPEDLEFGTFGWFVDPEGNKVELWQPS